MTQYVQQRQCFSQPLMELHPYICQSIYFKKYCYLNGTFYFFIGYFFSTCPLEISFPVFQACMEHMHLMCSSNLKVVMNASHTKSCAVYCQYSEMILSENSFLILELNMDIR